MEEEEEVKRSKLWRLIDLFFLLIILILFALIFKNIYEIEQLKVEEEANYEYAISDLESQPEDLCVNGEIKTDYEIPDDYENRYEPNEIIGYVYIPEVDMKASLAMGDAEDNLFGALAEGAAVDPTASLPGLAENTVIAGHRELEFSKLEEVEEGDTIVVNIEDNIFVYEVVRTQVIEDTDVGEVFIDEDYESVVLYTCYPFSMWQKVTNRYLVEGMAVESAEC